MDCIPVGKKIVTVSVQFHGTIIDLDLSPEIHTVFRNTRLFSYAGTYASAYYSHYDAAQRMREMQDTFAKDIENKSMVSQFNEYMTPIAEKYKEELTKKNKLEHEQISNVCKHIGPITVDKALAKGERNFIEKCIHSYILPDLEDIFVISVHEKMGENNYKLLSSREDAYKGLSNLSYFREKGRGDIVDMLIAESSTLPNFTRAKKEIEAIEKDATLSLEEKESRIQAIKEPIYSQIQQWKCSVDAGGNELTGIRMSMLSKVLQRLYGEDCYIQLIDYSCDEVSIFVPREQYVYKQYHRETDIEKGITEIKGGKKKTMKKRRFHTKNKKQRKRTRRQT